MKIPNNWSDFYNQDHNSKEISNGILNEFKLFIQENLEIIDLEKILEKAKLFFVSKKMKKVKVAINKNSTNEYIEFLLITEISKRLIRIVDLTKFKLKNESLITIGDLNFFQNHKFLF